MGDRTSQKQENPEIDRGWAWVVLVSCILLQTLSNGVVLGYGVYISEWIVFFQSTPSVIGWIGSIGASVFYMFSPIASALCNNYSHRIVTISGTILTAIGILSCSFAPNIYFLYFSYGVMVGGGASMCYAPAFMFVGRYFDRYKSLAMGLSSTGSALGPMVISPLSRLLMDEYGWRGALLITSAVVLNGGVCGALLWQPESWLPRVARVEKSNTLNGNDVSEDDAPKSKNTAAKRLLNLLDVDLLLNSDQWMLIVTRMAQIMGTYIWWMFIVDHAHSIGLSGVQAATTVTIATGTSALVCVAVAGLMLAFPRLDPAVLMSVSNLGSAMSSFLVPLASGTGGVYLMCILFGVCLGLFNAALGIIVIKTFGSQRATAAMSYLLVGAGVGALISPPVGGILYDINRNYENAFYFSGASFLVSFVVILFTVFKKCKRKLPVMKEKEMI